jgi:hypothetical protein
MSRFDLARARLDAALNTLEKTAKSAKSGEDSANGGARLAALEAEREKLLVRIAELEDEVAILSSTSAEVETRLDGAIGEIRAALAR